VYTHLLSNSNELIEPFAERLQHEFAEVVKEAESAVATLTYPAAEWAVPQDQSAQDAIQAAYDALVQPGSGRAPSATLTGVIGSYLTRGRRPLALPARSAGMPRGCTPRRHRPTQTGTGSIVLVLPDRDLG
jgi:hypothetical protein